MCAEGFCKKELQLSAQLEIVRKELQLSAQLDLKDRSTAECTDQNYCFVRSGIKHSFVDVDPTLGVNHVISCVVVILCCFCYVLLCIDK